jgi:putative tricarboxylic transport membrane protein
MQFSKMSSTLSSTLRRTLIQAGALGLLAALAPVASAAEAPFPDRTVEIIVTTGPGGAQDRTARIMQAVLQTGKLVTQPINVQNKPGGGGSLGMVYLNQHPGDGHYLLTTSPTILSNQIVGMTKLTYTDVEPVAQLFSEYVGFAVRTESPIKDAKDLLARLRKDPTALSAGIATSAGNHNHIAIGGVMKAAGADVRKLRIVVFKASGEAVTAVLGGHIDFIATTASNLVTLANDGKMRVIALASPERLPGPLASQPTWRELGVNAIGNNWRGVAAPKGTPAPQIRYWEDTLRKMANTPEWKSENEKNLWVGNYMGAKESAVEYKRQHEELRDILTDLGLVK